MSDKYQNIWTLLSDYKFEIDIDLHTDFICRICNGIMQNPHQTPCGCRYCYRCIDEHLRTEEKPCPGQMHDCKSQLLNMKNDVLIDHVANKRISMLKVKCPENSCQFKDELRHIGEHMESHRVNCPYSSIGCDIKIIDPDGIKGHMINENYSHASFMMNLIQNMQNEINYLADNARNKEKQFEEMKSQMLGKEDSLKTLIDKLTEDCQQKQILIEELLTKVGINETNAILFRQRVTNTLKEQEQTIISMKKSLKTQNKEPIDEHKSKNTIYFPEPRLFNKCSNDPDFVPFEFQINNYIDKISQAKAFFDSEYFYSHINGYRLCLRVYPSGCGEGENTHLSVFFSIMSGSFDDFLPWPMKHHVRISLIDQVSNSDHTVYQYDYESTNLNYRHVFMKPSLRCNVDYSDVKFFYGTQKFIHINSLISNNKIYRNGLIVLHCCLHK